MPQPQHMKFCPQCGCKQEEQRSASQVRFTCGEHVNKSEDGERLWSTYTCKTVPEIVPVLEEALGFAQFTLKDASITKAGMEMLTNLRTANQATQVQPKAMARARALIRRGFVCQPDPERPSVIQITAWGIYAHKYFKETRFA